MLFLGSSGSSASEARDMILEDSDTEQDQETPPETDVTP